MPPSDVEEVIDDAENDDSREGAICKSVGSKLGLSECMATYFRISDLPSQGEIGARISLSRLPGLRL